MCVCDSGRFFGLFVGWLDALSCLTSGLWCCGIGSSFVYLGLLAFSVYYYSG